MHTASLISKESKSRRNFPIYYSMQNRYIKFSFKNT